MLVCGWYRCVIELVFQDMHISIWIWLSIVTVGMLYQECLFVSSCVCDLLCALHLNIAMRYARVHKNGQLE